MDAIDYVSARTGEEIDEAVGIVLDGPIPIEKGGTDAVSAADARSKLGITPQNIGAVPLSGGTMNNSAVLSLREYGNRYLRLNGNNITLDMSEATGGWSTNFADLKDPTGKVTTAIGFYGGISGLNWIFFGGAYNDPFMKMTPNGQTAFKMVPTAGGLKLATVDDITAAIGTALEASY